MAFTSHGDFNMEVDVPLSVEYGKELNKIAGTTDVEYKYIRHAMKTYSFKGMTEAAAKACLAEKRMMYMRRIPAWDASVDAYGAVRHTRASSSGDTYLQVAEFTVTKRDVVFDLQITVDETIELYEMNRDYYLDNPEGVALIESLFMVKPEMAVDPRSWAWKYKYDEPGEDA